MVEFGDVRRPTIFDEDPWEIRHNVSILLKCDDEAGAESVREYIQNCRTSVRLCRFRHGPAVYSFLPHGTLTSVPANTVKAWGRLRGSEISAEGLLN